MSAHHLCVSGCEGSISLSMPSTGSRGCVRSRGRRGRRCAPRRRKPQRGAEARRQASHASRRWRRSGRVGCGPGRLLPVRTHRTGGQRSAASNHLPALTAQRSVARGRCRHRGERQARGRPDACRRRAAAGSRSALNSAVMAVSERVLQLGAGVARVERALAEVTYTLGSVPRPSTAESAVTPSPAGPRGSAAKDASRRLSARPARQAADGSAAVPTDAETGAAPRATVSIADQIQAVRRCWGATRRVSKGVLTGYVARSCAPMCVPRSSHKLTATCPRCWLGWAWPRFQRDRSSLTALVPQLREEFKSSSGEATVQLHGVRAPLCPRKPPLDCCDVALCVPAGA